MKNKYLSTYEEEINSDPFLKDYHQDILNYFGLNDEFMVTNISNKRISFNSKKNFYNNIEFVIKSSTFGSKELSVSIYRTLKYFSNDLNSIISKYDDVIKFLKSYSFSVLEEDSRKEEQKMNIINHCRKDCEINSIKNQKGMLSKFFQSKEDELKSHHVEYSFNNSCDIHKVKNLYGFILERCFFDFYNIKLHPDDNIFIQKYFKDDLVLTSLSIKGGETHLTHNLTLKNIDTIKKSVFFDENGRISDDSKEILLINFKV